MSSPSTSSDRLTASAVVSSRPARVMAVLAEADATNAATITIYDNASAASGKILVKIVVKAGNTYEFYASDDGVEADNGVYASISGTGAACIVHFVKM